jgi:hypothetical protein
VKRNAAGKCAPSEEPFVLENEDDELDAEDDDEEDGRDEEDMRWGSVHGLISCEDQELRSVWNMECDSTRHKAMRVLGLS